MKRWMLCAVALALNSVACPPAPTPPGPDASDAAVLGDGAASCTKVCIHFGEIGCLESADQECEQSVCSPLVSAKTRSCWFDAPTKEAARACGQLRCP